jgi:hypothetical protein
MKKYEWQDSIPDYDPVQCKREAHRRIRRETEGMTDEEVCEYFRKSSERAQKERAEYRAKHGIE